MKKKLFPKLLIALFFIAVTGKWFIEFVSYYQDQLGSGECFLAVTTLAAFVLTPKKLMPWVYATGFYAILSWEWFKDFEGYWFSILGLAGTLFTLAWLWQIQEEESPKTKHGSAEFPDMRYK